jgi:hypothetical protein
MFDLLMKLLFDLFYPGESRIDPNRALSHSFNNSEF